MSTPIVHLVDDDPDVRDGLTMLLETAGFAVQSYADAVDFLGAGSCAESGCLILDLRMPGMDGIELQETLVRRRVGLPIIFLSAYGDVPTTVRAIQNGAVDFLMKPVNGRVLIEKIRQTVARQETRRRQDAARGEFLGLLGRLSKREKQVLALAIAGKANKKIGQDLNLSHRTVESHRARIFLKGGVGSLLEFMQKAAAAGVQLSAADLMDGDSALLCQVPIVERRRWRRIA